MGKLKTIEQIMLEGIDIEVVEGGQVTVSTSIQRCPEWGGKCNFEGTREEVRQHLDNIEKMKQELAKGIDIFVQDGRKQ